jgi:hypothetical protein
MPINPNKTKWEVQSSGPIVVILADATTSARARLRREAKANGHSLRDFAHIGYAQASTDKPDERSIYLAATYCRRCELAVLEARGSKEITYRANPLFNERCPGKFIKVI